MFDIITIGSATRDVFFQTKNFETRQHQDSPTNLEQCLALGSKIEVEKMVLSTGGGGTNAAVTFARQGLKTACLGVVGEDVVGQEILAELIKEGVDTSYFQRHTDDHTAYSVILVNSSGERTILSYKGEGQHLLAEKVSWDQLQAPWFYLDSLGGHFDFLEKVFKHAQEQGIKIAFNPGGKELAHGWDQLSPFLPRVEVLIVNREEGARLLGLKYENFDEILEQLGSLGCRLVIISDGPRGVRVREGRKREYRAGVPASPVVERTGAGDAFGSGFVAAYWRALAEKISPEQAIVRAIQLATANASAVVTRFGAKEGILRKGDSGPWPLVPVEVIEMEN